MNDSSFRKFLKSRVINCVRTELNTLRCQPLDFPFPETFSSSSKRFIDVPTDKKHRGPKTKPFKDGKGCRVEVSEAVVEGDYNWLPGKRRATGHAPEPPDSFRKRENLAPRFTQERHVCLKGLWAGDDAVIGWHGVVQILGDAVVHQDRDLQIARGPRRPDERLGKVKAEESIEAHWPAATRDHSKASPQLQGSRPSF